MLIGLISDTHGRITNAALKALSDCDHIIHAGDIGSSKVLDSLEAIAPVTAVLGNCDWNDYGPLVDAKASPLLDHVRFLVVHRPSDIGAVPPDVSVVVHGHSHRRRRDFLDGVYYLNPGSAIDPHDGLPPAVALVEVDRGTVGEIRFVDLRPFA